MTIERDENGRFVKGGKKNPKSYIWKIGEKQSKKAYRKGLTKYNNESVKRQSIKVSKTLKRLYAEGKRIPLKELPMNRGEKHWHWKGGIASENERLRKSPQYKLWRKAVFERDDYTCIWCGYKGNKLNADHIKPFALFPELRFAIDNGRTLCEDCHRKTDTYGGNSK